MAVAMTLAVVSLTGWAGGAPGAEDPWPWMRCRAEGGHVPSQTMLGTFLYKARGEHKDLAGALRWLTMAAERGDPDAQYLLGVMYWHGQGVHPDLSRALWWMVLSAAQGNRLAARNRERLEPRVTPEVVADILARAQEWQPLPGLATPPPDCSE